MPELIHQYTSTVRSDEGRSYTASAFGEEREDGVWVGWLEFDSAEGENLSTNSETTQPDRDALVSWAKSVEQAQLEEAFERARGGGA
jgi:hypothetical protein